MKVGATLIVNGTSYPVELDPGTNLLAAVRDVIGLTGSKEGCDDSECGACMMLLDGQPRELVLVPRAAGGGPRDHDRGGPRRRRRRWRRCRRRSSSEGGVQCGFCTPGMLISATALLAANPAPTEDEVRIGLSGNLCRCTGYDGIVKAVLSVAGA